MTKNLKSESGVSLIELLVGVAVTALMMGAMLATYTVVNNSYRQVLLIKRQLVLRAEI